MQPNATQVSLLHLLLDTLAFKNDIQFWKNLETMDGLSGRAETGSRVLQVIVLAYVRVHCVFWLLLLLLLLILPLPLALLIIIICFCFCFFPN